MYCTDNWSVYQYRPIAVLEDARNRILQGLVWVQKNFRGLQARNFYQRLRKRATTLQSSIRGWLARKNYINLKMHEMSKFNHVEVNKSSERNLPQLMKYVEEIVYDKYLTEFVSFIQSTLAAARKSLTSDMANQPGKLNMLAVNSCYDSEDSISTVNQIPEDTPAKQSIEAEEVRSNDSKEIAVIHLVNEFEQQRQVFEDDAGFIVEAKSGQSSSKINPDEELQKLKARFSTWRKVYKLRLRETKESLQKFGNPEEKASKKWWSIRSIR
ncbi:hypothetical protein GW17_00023923 [Ensete ventricosum]|nr:hypothetical protein GW17_00023923 [Ensete ventricosum]